jgi:uncharacterized repeat protein (TIGR03803 family)
MPLLLASFATQLAQAQTFKVLHTFHGPNGANPVGALTIDAAGNIYGTTRVGGAGRCTGGTGCGTAFKLGSNGKQIWLYKFNGSDGDVPYSELLRDSSGSLLGTTGGGGDLSCNPPYGCGTVFTLDKTGQREKVLYKFTGSPDGSGPYGSFVEDGSGNAYGATSGGGSDLQGTVFEIDAAGTESVLHSFAGPPGGGGDGSIPEGGVIRDAAGNLYGVTFQGGAYGPGTVYEVDSSGNETLLYSFSGSSDGGYPSSTLLLDSQGNLYGTTQNGGTSSGCGLGGCGAVFELSPQSGGGWTEKVLYDFCSLSGCADGEEPFEGPLAMDAAGNLYGTTYFGGTADHGVVFKLDTAGQESVLHSFTGGADGALPVAGVILDSRIHLYGTTQEGGDLNCQPQFGGCGVVFEITP